MTQVPVLNEILATWLRQHQGDETGASLVEYALLLVLILLTAIVSMVFLGNATHVPINNVASHLSHAP